MSPDDALMEKLVLAGWGFKFDTQEGVERRYIWIVKSGLYVYQLKQAESWGSITINTGGQREAITNIGQLVRMIPNHIKEYYAGSVKRYLQYVHPNLQRYLKEE